MGDDQWQVAGGAAQVYERELVPAIFQPWAPRVLALAAPAASERVLDAACGTGVVGPAGRRAGRPGRSTLLHVTARALFPSWPAGVQAVTVRQ